MAGVYHRAVTKKLLQLTRKKKQNKKYLKTQHIYFQRFELLSKCRVCFSSHRKALVVINVWLEIQGGGEYPKELLLPLCQITTPTQREDDNHIIQHDEKDTKTKKIATPYVRVCVFWGLCFSGFLIGKHKRSTLKYMGLIRCRCSTECRIVA